VGSLPSITRIGRGANLLLCLLVRSSRSRFSRDCIRSSVIRSHAVVRLPRRHFHVRVFTLLVLHELGFLHVVWCFIAGAPSVCLRCCWRRAFGGCARVGEWVGCLGSFVGDIAGLRCYSRIIGEGEWICCVAASQCWCCELSAGKARDSRQSLLEEWHCG